MRRIISILGLVVAVACGGGGGGGGGEQPPPGCLAGRACATACTGPSECGLTEVCTDGLCAQPAPTSTEYVACTLDAQCPRGDFCALGACVHECLADRDCSGGTVCTSRGRCVAAAEVGQPPPVTQPTIGKPAVEPAFLDFGPSATTLAFTLTNGGDAPFDYRLLSGRKWAAATPSSGRLAAGEEVEITVAIDRAAALADSAQGGFIAVNTTAGYLRVDLTADADLSGAWAGVLQVRSPGALGGHTLAVNLTQNGNTLSGWVDAERSTLYPLRAVVGGDVLPGDAVTFGFDLPSPKDSPQNPVFPKDIIRHFVFSGVRTDAGTIQGSFTESFDGILDDLQTKISGDAIFTRVGPVPEGGAEDAPIAIIARAGNPMEDEAGALKAPYAACTGCPGGTCLNSGDRALAYLRELDGDGMPKLAFYAAFRQAADGAGTPFQSYDACAPTGEPCLILARFDAQSLRCAEYWGWKGGPDAAGYLLDGLEVSIDAALLVGNALTAKALDAWYNPLSSLRNQAGSLADAERVYISGLHSSSQTEPIALLDPFFATVLAGRAQTGATSRPYSLGGPPVNAETLDRGPGEHVRRALRAIDSALFAANQRADLLRRAGDDARARTAVRDAAVRTWIDLATLAPVLATSEPTWANDLAPIANGLREAARRDADVAQGRNLFGYYPTYVPFFWHYTGSQGTTNFTQILDLAKTAQRDWEGLAAGVSNSMRAFESSANDLRTELESQVAAIDIQLTELCGSPVISAGMCGAERKGQFWETILELEAAVLRADAIEKQIANIPRAVQIEEERAAQVAGLHENQAMLVLETGDRVYAAEKAMRKIDTDARVKHGFLSAISGVLKVVLSPQKLVSPGDAIGDFVTGIGGAAIDAAAANSRERYEKDRADAIATQNAQVEFNAAQEQLIDSAARIKTELLQLDVLAVDLGVANVNIAQVTVRLETLLARASALVQEKARVNAMAERNARYALHYRVFANAKARRAADAMNLALEWSYFSTRGLEYQLASTLGAWAELWGAREPGDLSSYISGLEIAAGRQRTSQSNRDVVSLREDVLGMGTPIKDPVTGAEVTPRERFRRFVADPANRDARGNLRIVFATDSLDQRMFSSSVCSDRIRTVRVNLIGDALGARVTSGYVKIVHGGTTYLRSCTRQADGTTTLIAYDMTANGNGPAVARVHAAINGTTDGTPGMDPNVELNERAVLASSWELVIEQGDNANLNVLGLDDIELTFEHDSYTIQ